MTTPQGLNLRYNPAGIPTLSDFFKLAGTPLSTAHNFTTAMAR